MYPEVLCGDQFQQRVWGWGAVMQPMGPGQGASGGPRGKPGNSKDLVL